MKKCRSCGEMKNVEDFNKDSSRKDGLQVYCKPCGRLKIRSSYWKDAEHSRLKARNKEYNKSENKSDYTTRYYAQNKDRISERESKRRQDPEIKAKLLKYNNELEKRRMSSDPKYRFTKNLRSNIRFAIKKYSINGKTNSCRDYGIDFDEIFSIIGPRPSKKHELDHIIPITKFNLDDAEHVRLAHLPCNLRWLDSKENKIKSDKIPEFVNGIPELVSILTAIGLL